MSRKERKRLALQAQVKSGELKLVTAGEVMGVTYRQAKRVANSPQAKGRVERMNGVLQDRLVKALRLERISEVGRANEFLAPKCSCRR